MEFDKTRWSWSWNIDQNTQTLPGRIRDLRNVRGVGDLEGIRVWEGSDGGSGLGDVGLRNVML